MRKSTAAACAGAALLLAAIAAAAGDGTRMRISLAQALEIAMTSNRALRAANLHKEAVAEGVGEARGAMLPRLDAVENFTNSNNPTTSFSNLLNQQDFAMSNLDIQKLNFPSPLSNFNSQIRLTQPLFTGGKLLAALRAAAASSDAEKWHTLRERQEIAFRVVGAYYDSILADRQLEVVERALGSAQAHQRQAADLFSRGMVVKSDVLRTQVMVGGFEQERIEAQNRLRISLVALAHVLGIEEREIQPLEAPAELDASRHRLPANLKDVVASAIDRRPELRVAQAEVRGALERLKMAEADYMPSISVGAAYQNDTEHFARAGNSYTVFVSGQVNLFNGLATTSRVSAARAELKRAEVLREDIRHAIALDVDTAYRTLSAARDRLKVAERDLAQAAEALAIIRDRYGSGLATNVEVLDAEASDEQAQLRAAQTRVGVQVAAAALQLASGLMPGSQTTRDPG